LGAEPSYTGLIFKFPCSGGTESRKKSSKFDRNIFLPYWLETITIASQKVWYVWGTKPSHLALFSTFPTPVVPGPEKVVKTCPRPFLHVRMRNDKKCVPNRVDMFWVPKPSHPGPVFNFACSGGAWARKSCQNPIETNFSRIDGKWKELHPKKCGYISGAKPSHTGPIFISACSGGRRARKSLQNSTETFFRGSGLEMIRSVPRVIWVCFGCKTESYGLDFQLSLLGWYRAP